MVAPKMQLSRDPAYERFLGAQVGEDRTGTSVSVLSMLARLDVDPWGEASDLADMQESPAQQRLEALLARFKDVPTQVSDRGKVALSLLAFLPRRAEPAGSSPKDAAAPSVSFPNGAPIYWIIAAGFLLGWVATFLQGN